MCPICCLFIFRGWNMSPTYDAHYKQVRILLWWTRLEKNLHLEACRTNPCQMPWSTLTDFPHREEAETLLQSIQMFRLLALSKGNPLQLLVSSLWFLRLLPQGLGHRWSRSTGKLLPLHHHTNNSCIAVGPSPLSLAVCSCICCVCAALKSMSSLPLCLLCGFRVRLHSIICTSLPHKDTYLIDNACLIQMQWVGPWKDQQRFNKKCIVGKTKQLKFPHSIGTCCVHLNCVCVCSPLPEGMCALRGRLLAISQDAIFNGISLGCT